MVKKRIVEKAIVLFFISAAIFLTFYVDHVYPGVTISGVSVSGKKQDEVTSLLKSKTNIPQDLTFSYNDQSFKIPTSTLDLNYDFTKTSKRAIQVGRSGNPIFDIQEILNSILGKKNLGRDFTINEDQLNSFISETSIQIITTPKNPSIQIIDKEVVINPGKPGTKIDLQKLRADISQNLSFANENPIPIELQEDDPSLTKDEVSILQTKANSLIGKKININFEGEEFPIDDSILVSLLNPKGGWSENSISQTIDQVTKEFERDPQNAKFDFASGYVKSFLPDRDGITIKKDELKTQIQNALESLNSNQIANIDLPVEKTPAKIKTSDVNNLGIKELIGSGTSHFAGSASSRIHNISLASSILDGTLIAPGETFSFNKTIGDISIDTGYLQAYIIQNGQTVLGDGGGVCQVSTTLFRAALNTGLPIIQRTAHAYRVYYYEQDALPGFDATVYSPTVDLKFKNDTQNYILIQTQLDLRRLVLTFNLYGTSDARSVDITKPVLWDYTPAPAALYTDDPTLPKGTIKQIDFAAPGTKSKFEYTVTRNNEIINKQTFYSNFKPWQARYLRGTM